MQILLIVICIIVVVVAAVVVFEWYNNQEDEVKEYHVEVVNPANMTIYGTGSNVSQAGYGLSYEYEGVNYYLDQEGFEMVMERSDNSTELMDEFYKYYGDDGFKSYTSQLDKTNFSFEYKDTNETIGNDTNAKVITHMYNAKTGEDVLNAANLDKSGSN